MKKVTRSKETSRKKLPTRRSVQRPIERDLLAAVDQDFIERPSPKAYDLIVAI
jgi:hypothetical protein